MHCRSCGSIIKNFIVSNVEMNQGNSLDFGAELESGNKLLNNTNRSQYITHLREGGIIMPLLIY